MKKNIIIFGLIAVMVLAGCSQNIGTRVSRSVEINGKPVEINGQDYIVNISGSQPTTISEITITQPENSKTQILASVDNRLVERNGSKVVLTTVTIEEIGPVAGIPFYVWILLAIIAILTIITIIACSTGGSDNKEEKPEPEPEPVAVPAPEPEMVVAEETDYAEIFIEEGKTKHKKYVPKIYGIDSIHDLIVITKNTANKADEIQNKCRELKAEIRDLNAQIRENSGDAYADEIRRERLRTVKNNKHARLVYLSIEGQQAETSNDDYAYLLKKLTDQDSDFRDTERFNEEKLVSVTPYDVVWLKKHLNLK